MRKFKKIFVVLMVLTLMFALVACSNSTNAGSSGETKQETKQVKVKFAHWFAEDHPQHLALLKFKELIEQKSNGNMVVEIYPNSQLGSEDTFIDSVKAGTVEMGAPGTMLSKFDPQIAASELPFLFNGWEDAKAVYTGEVGQYITKNLPEKAGLRCLAITVNGFRQFSSNKSMMSIEEMAGQRFRVPNVPHFLKMVEALNANPIAMPLTEVFTALEQDVVDGQENPYATIQTSSMYEVQKYVLESNHMFSPSHWVINEEFYQELTDEQKEVLNSSIKEAAEYNWTISAEANDKSKQFLKNKNVTVIETDDAFKQALVDTQEPVYDWFYGNYPGSEEVVKMVRDLQANLK